MEARREKQPPPLHCLARHQARACQLSAHATRRCGALPLRVPMVFPPLSWPSGLASPALRLCGSWPSCAPKASFYPPYIR